jgi:stalled ribosome rescue protein Dom34
MKKSAGLWIDHRQAYIVFAEGDADKTHKIESGMEKHVRYTEGPSSDKHSAEDQRDRQFNAHLDKYYDAVISILHGAESILIFGPGEAKGEFEKRLAHQGLGKHIVGIETVDKMTEPQIAAKVRNYFGKTPQPVQPSH